MKVTSIPRDSLLGAVREANGQAPLISATDLMVMADLHGMYASDIVELSRLAPEKRGPLDEDLQAFVETLRVQSDLRLLQGLEGASSGDMRSDAQGKAGRAEAAKKVALRHLWIGLGATAATGALAAGLQSPVLGIGAIVGLGASVYCLGSFQDSKEDQRSAAESVERLAYWEARLQPAELSPAE
ncbi:MAG: hypothetical protein HY319_31370 [Armatimonadetes bacterium]|nr:hypothetical protein [Armatimonadota bacterium]